MMRAILAALAMLMAGSSVEAWPWADEVVSYNPGPSQFVGVFHDPAVLLGRPYGISVSEAENQSIVTLGDGGNVVLRFFEPIRDDARNPHGLDFIVFSNCIWSGGDPTRRWQEAGFVEVSQDGVNWFLILPNILPADLVVPPSANPDIGISKTPLRGYAEYTPTLPLPTGVAAEFFYTVPDRQSYAGDSASLLIDDGSGGGDAFDIASAVRQVAPGVPEVIDGQNVPANLSWISYVRITDARVGDTLGSLGEVSAEIDAAAVVMPTAQNLGAALREGDQAIVRVSDAVVVRGFGADGAFVHAANQSCGTLITGLDQPQPGQKLEIVGKLSDNADGRSIAAFASRIIETLTAPQTVTASVETLARNNQLSPTGMVVRTWGWVRHSGNAGEFFVEGAAGDRIRIVSPFAPPAEDAFVTVTGGTRSTAPAPTLTCRSESDIFVAAP